jgi:hypothetical protein
VVHSLISIHKEMIPKGAHEPMSGALRDSHAIYSGMKAVTPAGIEALFDDAEVMHNL